MGSYLKIIRKSPIYKIWNFPDTQEMSVNDLVDFYAHELHKYLTKACKNK